MTSSEDKDQKEDFPVLPLRDIVVFPHMIVPLFVGREKSVRALEDVMKDDKQILLVAQKNAADDDPGKDDIYQIGTVSTVLQLLKLPDGTVKVLHVEESPGTCEVTAGESLFAIDVAKANAGGSVIEPDSNPEILMKFIFPNFLQMTPMISRGAKVTTTPRPTHFSPSLVNTVSKNRSPANNPTQARKRMIPNSRSARLVLSGIFTISGPILPRRLKRIATSSGPPANPSRRGAGSQSSFAGNRPTKTPRAIPRKIVAKLVWSRRCTSLPSIFVASSKLDSGPTI